MSKFCTGTELLIEVMENFSAAEPTAAMIVWTDEDGNINMKTNCLNSHSLGLAVFAQQNLIEGIFKQ